ncbi:glycoside hydrolase family 88 protein [Aequorivita sinensis]|uniref:glycoside hydrolase family 88 protein n=1 Tax=Aequorivita sinensis TaxID=1382458 RepID=UPI00112108E9|nr:glycoside hydrolase family 88 protein [Aequorivita sinensis]
MFKKKIFWVILIISITANILVVCLDTVPFIWPKIERNFLPEKTLQINDNSIKVILNQSIEMIDTHNNNVWSDPKGFTETLYSLYVRKPQKEFKTYNYPKAYLYYGLSSYLLKNKDSINLSKVKLSFDKLLNSRGEPTFNFDKVDQVPFGLTAINLHKVYGDEKYLKFCEVLFNKIKSLQNDDGLILYRENGLVQLNDVLGMIVPFLVDYSEYVNRPEALLIAKKQLEFYVEYGVDKETYLPTHGIDLRSNTKVGPTNWGRGIGWYFLGLSHYYKATGEFSQEFKGLSKTLAELRMENDLWSQFPGSSSLFDASSTTMFIYAMDIKGELSNKKELINSLFSYISHDGFILHTSGDTYGINDYSKSFGTSELSQGFLLLIL